ncbi:hypothetical protein NX059_009189 [Plenodomus lindquistii]|nr:hypothetical protein NX059_009189 [Plenodomus lindquistii]
MSEASNSAEFALQICFGTFGVLGTFATLASLHHRDLLGCMLLCRMWPSVIHDDGDDLESATSSPEDLSDTNNDTNDSDPDVPLRRRTTLPPPYKPADGNSRANSDGLTTDDDAASSSKIKGATTNIVGQE